MEINMNTQFSALSFDEMMEINGGWGWKDTLNVVGVVILVGTAVTVALACPPVAVVAASTAIKVGIVGGITGTALTSF